MTRNLSQGRGKYIVWAVAALLLFGVASCAAAPAPTTPQPVSPVATPEPMMPMMPPAGAPGMMMGDVTVMLTNGKVALEPAGFDAGTVRFMVRNEGTVAHALAIEGQGIDARTPDLQPGESAVLDVTLAAGEYEAYCPVNGHRERGMTTTFTVAVPD